MLRSYLFFAILGCLGFATAIPNPKMATSTTVTMHDNDKIPGMKYSKLGKESDYISPTLNQGQSLNVTSRLYQKGWIRRNILDRLTWTRLFSKKNLRGQTTRRGLFTYFCSAFRICTKNHWDHYRAGFPHWFMSWIPKIRAKQVAGGADYRHSLPRKLFELIPGTDKSELVQNPKIYETRK